MPFSCKALGLGTAVVPGSLPVQKLPFLQDKEPSTRSSTCHMGACPSEGSHIVTCGVGLLAYNRVFTGLLRHRNRSLYCVEAFYADVYFLRVILHTIQMWEYWVRVLCFCGLVLHVSLVLFYCSLLQVGKWDDLWKPPSETGLFPRVEWSWSKNEQLNFIKRRSRIAPVKHEVNSWSTIREYN